MSLSTASVLEVLRQIKPILSEQFGVARLALFGSFARGDATDASDIDLLVGFEPDARPTLFSLADMDALIERHVGRHVDSVPESCVNPRLESFIRSDLLVV
jgi:predicted nucleotidyltransferase